jgi:hypothetical protein
MFQSILSFSTVRVIFLFIGGWCFLSSSPVQAQEEKYMIYGCTSKNLVGTGNTEASAIFMLTRSGASKCCQGDDLTTGRYFVKESSSPRCQLVDGEVFYCKADKIKFRWVECQVKDR